MNLLTAIPDIDRDKRLNLFMGPNSRLLLLFFKEESCVLYAGTFPVPKLPFKLTLVAALVVEPINCTNEQIYETMSFIIDDVKKNNNQAHIPELSKTS